MLLAITMLLFNNVREHSNVDNAIYRISISDLQATQDMDSIAGMPDNSNSKETLGKGDFLGKAKTSIILR